MARPDMRYTLCFLTRGDDILMLKRNHAPNRGLWNGVGGKIGPGETPVDAIGRHQGLLQQSGAGPPVA